MAKNSIIKMSVTCQDIIILPQFLESDHEIVGVMTV